MTFLRLPDGNVAHVRMSKPRSKRCKVCNHLTAQRFQRECDFKLPNGRTCDLLMCQHCTTHTGPDTDLCPAHVLATEKRKTA